MDLLKQALLAKKQQVEQKKEVAKQVAETEGRKYLSRGEISEIEAAKEAAKRRRDEEDQAEKRKRVKEDPSRQGETKDSSLDMDAAAPSSELELDPEEVKMRLRSMGEPITLFGETDKMRLDRLRLLQLTLSERAANTTGRSNMMHDILQREVASEIMRLTEEQVELSKTQSDEQKAAAMKKEQKKASKYDVPRARSACSSAEDYIFYFFKRILRLWERDLQERPDAEKRTAAGQRASAAQKQTRHNLKPLMKQLSNRTVDKALVTGLEKVVLLCEQREYIKANEEYLLIAIGNAAWPIGVTMVGIHERSGREKIFAQNVAHVLNDETSRKYIQGVKRLMTFHQTKYPNADASKNIQSRNQV